MESKSGSKKEGRVVESKSVKARERTYYAHSVVLAVLVCLMWLLLLMLEPLRSYYGSFAARALLTAQEISQGTVAIPFLAVLSLLLIWLGVKLIAQRQLSASKTSAFSWKQLALALTALLLLMLVQRWLAAAMAEQIIQSSTSLISAGSYMLISKTAAAYSTTLLVLIVVPLFAAEEICRRIWQHKKQQQEEAAARPTGELYI